MPAFCNFPFISMHFPNTYLDDDMDEEDIEGNKPLTMEEFRQKAAEKLEVTIWFRTERLMLKIEISQKLKQGKKRIQISDFIYINRFLPLKLCLLQNLYWLIAGITLVGVLQYILVDLLLKGRSQLDGLTFLDLVHHRFSDEGFRVQGNFQLLFFL